MTQRDCTVFHRDLLDSDVAQDYLYEWLVETDEYIEQFPDEESACEFQRVWRKQHGLDPITGHPVN